MKIHRSLSYLRTTFVIQLIIPYFSVFSEDPSFQLALEKAGENRPELEAALQQLPGRDMGFLISHARQFDLVNLKAELLTTNLRLAREAYATSELIHPKYNYEMWRDYVLPYRVMEEDLSNWRPMLRKELEPVIADATSVQDAAQRIFKWLHQVQPDGNPRVRFVATENRNQNPLQLLHNRNGGCKEMHITYVCALRSVGIPARLCTVAWWTTGDWYHYFVQYYDPAIQDWRGIDASNTAGMDPADWNRNKATWHVMKAYAYPSYPAVKDVDGMQRWDLCTDITEYLCETGTLTVTPGTKEQTRIGLYTWNLGAWRLIGIETSESGEAVSMTVGETKKDRPLLVSAISPAGQALALTDIEAKQVRHLQLKPGMTLLQSTGNQP